MTVIMPSYLMLTPCVRLLMEISFTYSKDPQVLILELFECLAVEKNWSPNALCLRLKHELPASIKMPSVELIYQWIYEDSW